MRFYRRFSDRSSADGTFRVVCAGAQTARLSWDGMAEAYATWAVIPMGGEGCGTFTLTGGRAVPPGATHIRVTAELADGDTRTRRFPIPASHQTQRMAPQLRIALMSDLHMAGKPFRVRGALRRASEYDVILLAGDITNDGVPEQFEHVRQLIEEEALDMPVLAVCGNHDFPHRPLPEVFEGVSNAVLFQHWLLERAAHMGIEICEDVSGAFAARIGSVRIVGLNAVSHWRRFVFRDGAQLDFLQAQLAAPHDGYTIVMCHAPLAAHRPIHPGEAPYLGRDARLQAIIDGARNVIFHSGHTHVTMNDLCSCVERDTRGNIYVNDGSVCPTALRTQEAAIDDAWHCGAMAELNIAANEGEIIGRAIRSGQRFGRAYYRFARET